MFLRKIFFLLSLASCALFEVFSQSTSIPGLYKYKLENGLELFVMENDAAPLAYIEIAVRAGAVTQTAENAGLFHLYEHMMFKGNKKFPDQKAVTQALNKMGVSDWNGTTGVDRVNYYFTVPSNLVKNGLEFWSYAIRTPLLDQNELENEKEVVLSEITGNLSNPGRIFGAAVFNTLFPESPWRMDTSGNPDTIRNATVEQLKQIQQEYYVPENTILYVGGNVQHSQVLDYVKHIYSGWQRGTNQNALKVKIPSKTPLKKDTLLVYPDPRNSGNIFQFIYYLRGPDGETDRDETYAADVWSYLCSNPSGEYLKKIVENKKLSIPDADYTGCSYSTQRASGMIGFSAAMMNDSDLSAVVKGREFLNHIKNVSIPDMLKKNTGFEKKDIQKVNQRLSDNRIYSMETAAGFLAGLSSSAAASGSDYFLTYDKNISKVTNKDIQEFVKKYIQDKNGVAVLLVSPSYFEQHKEEFFQEGYQQISQENAFWWRSEK